MIEVEVMVFPERTRRRARVDPSVPLEKIKIDMVKALGIGEPEEYEIAVSPRSTRQTYQNLRPTPGDTIILVRKEDLAGSSVELIG
ncbi:MAG: hypothetical protein DRH43_10680 [Deltaproteobacteria bacterium]|nr:MAG: hypothetical protein DRH43_10680 [Deltaproteobacteria bacterium]